MRTRQPNLESFIPAARHQTAVVWSFDPLCDLDGSIMLGDLNGLVTVEIPHLGCLVTAACEHFSAILKRARCNRIHAVTHL